MRVLVTGSAGYLGSRLAEALAAEGLSVTGLDREEASDPVVPTLRVDLSDTTALAEALDGVDLIAHCASIHPWKRYSDSDYIRCNIEGTWHLYSAAVRATVRAFVLTSSIAAAGYTAVPRAAWPVPEDAQFPLGDLYSLTKHAQEDAARLFATVHGVRTLALRPPAFMPAASEAETGFRLMGTYAVVDDIVAAHVAAVRVLAGVSEPGGPLALFEAVNTTNALPYQPEDSPLVGPGGDPLPLARKYWPHAAHWAEQHGYVPGWLAAVYDISKAERLLGWRPRVGFAEWFAAHTGRCPVTGETV